MQQLRQNENINRNGQTDDYGGDGSMLGVLTTEDTTLFSYTVIVCLLPTPTISLFARGTPPNHGLDGGNFHLITNSPHVLRQTRQFGGADARQSLEGPDRAEDGTHRGWMAGVDRFRP